MEITAKLVAEYLSGEVVGDPNARVTKPARIEEGKPGTLCFLANPKYEQYLYTTKATIVLVNKSLELKNQVDCTLVKVDNAYEGIAMMLQLFAQQKDRYKGHSWRASVAFSAKIGKNVYIGPSAVIERKAKVGKNSKIYPQVYVGENVEIGENVILYPGVKIYHNCRIGNNCIFHSGVVIGSDGFGFAPDANNVYRKIPQLGNVIIEDDVEIGSNTVVDRATMGSTIIHKGVKLDNLIQIAHNVEVGENTVMAGQSGIAGSAKVGKNCVIAAQVGIVGHIRVADGVKVGGQSGVSNNILKENEIVLGSPAIPASEAKRVIAIHRRLPDLRQQVIDLEKEVKLLKEQGRQS
jgi:UDP-3-O-[3-hydroxymyristoyl] glucosamine N-acyltransferase